MVALSFWKIGVSYLKGAKMNFKHKFKNWFCYERDIKIKTNKKDCKYAWKKN